MSASTESVHGALLVLVELAENCNRFFDNSLKEFCDIMFRYVRLPILSTFPPMACHW